MNVRQARVLAFVAALSTACVAAESESNDGAHCDADIDCLVKELTFDEKLQFFAGDLDAIDHISGVPRLGIPDINMGDGPNGVANTIPGTATSFPCNMAVGDSFDHELTRKYAQAMAKEFKGKGKNQILGPGANLARMPENGRTDEYITGDDPVLGAELIPEFVKGALDEHVMVTIKHFVNNDQETNRNDWSGNPDTNVLMEYYMKPFFAGIKAGAASIMCGYNKVLGEHACKNKDILQAAKNAGRHFWIVSDWGAVYPDGEGEGAADYINAGLDMEMGAHDDPDCTGPDVPETEYGAGGYCNKGDYMLPEHLKPLVDSGKVSKERIDETVRRVLGALKVAGLLNKSVQEEFPEYVEKDLHSKWYGPLAQKDVRTTFSRAISHEVARKAMVMLQNNDDLLPLSTEDKIDLYGCGDVHFRAETGSAAGTEPHMPNSPCEPGDETACPSPEDAVKKLATVDVYSLEDAKGGPKDPDSVAVICLQAVSKNSEGTDRENLDIEGGDIPFDQFGKVVVYVVSPGPLLMPFAPQVGAILFSSLPGEMGGSAFADILFGKASPSGHLSLTMPNKGQETGVVAQQDSDDYNEAFEVGHRWYQANDKNPNFAFGWGLSYAKYIQVIEANLSEPSRGGRPMVSLKLWSHNTDLKVGDDGVDVVVQLYVQHKAPQERKFKELAGFGKAKNLQEGQLVWMQIGFDRPKLWGSEPGEKAGFDKNWEQVTEYVVFISLYGVEHAIPLFSVKVEGVDHAVEAEHDFDEDGPINFDQDFAVWERATKRGIDIEKPKDHVWGDAPTEVSDQQHHHPSAHSQLTDHGPTGPAKVSRKFEFLGPLALACGQVAFSVVFIVGFAMAVVSAGAAALRRVRAFQRQRSLLHESGEVSALVTDRGLGSSPAWGPNV